jgi:hypothetical protein
MARPTRDFLPDEHDVLGVLRRRGCLSLRAVCAELWPDLRWRPLYDGEDSMSEGTTQGAHGLTRALWVWQVLGRLIAEGGVQVAGQDPDEVDTLAAVSFELLGRREGQASARGAALA